MFWTNATFTPIGNHGGAHAALHYYYSRIHVSSIVSVIVSYVSDSGTLFLACITVLHLTNPRNPHSHCSPGLLGVMKIL